MEKNYLNTVKHTGHKVPNGYFDAFEKDLFDAVHAKNQLKSVKSSGFTVPEGYFDNLETSLLPLNTKKSSKVLPLISKKTLVYISGIAAAILLLFNLHIFKKDSITLNDIEVATVEQYIINEDISSYYIASLLEDEQLRFENFIDYNLNKTQIEDYLLTDVEDLESLMIE